MTRRLLSRRAVLGLTAIAAAGLAAVPVAADEPVRDSGTVLPATLSAHGLAAFGDDCAAGVGAHGGLSVSRV